MNFVIHICGITSLFFCAIPLSANEVVLHTGPPVSTPASTPVSPIHESDKPKLVTYQREFFIDINLLNSLPAPSSYYGTVPVSAVEAIDLANKDIDPDGGLQTMIISAVRLMQGPSHGGRQVEYYLVSILANGSEVHRIVLMNRKVITSRLHEIKE